MKRRLGGIGLAAALVVAAGCGTSLTDDEAPDVEEEQTGIALGIDVRDGTDVEGFEYIIRECDGDVVVRESRALEELTLPAGIAVFERAPFDEDSEHEFADYFTALTAGCYDVEVRPLARGGSPSSDCDSASASQIFVVDGKTTEILLISQCKGDEVGGLDIIAALNNPPVIESVNYDPSKFAFECELVEICVTAFDPDGDGLEFEFEQVAGDKLRFPMTFTEPVVEGNRATACMQAVPIFNDDYKFRVTVYDQVWDGRQRVRTEDLFGVHSRAQLTFPMYTNWDFELECYDPQSDQFHPFRGTREIDRVPGCEPIWPEQFFCSELHWDETDRTCPGGEFLPEEVYPLCHEHEGLYEVR